VIQEVSGGIDCHVQSATSRNPGILSLICKLCVISFIIKMKTSLIPAVWALNYIKNRVSLGCLRINVQIISSGFKYTFEVIL
jgi:hypothetical protein